MKIVQIETIHLRFEYPNAHGFRYAGGICTSRLTSIVRVHTDSGHIGIGSCYTHPGMAELVIKGQLEPMLLGRDATDVEELWQLMYVLTRWYGRKGAAMSALGAVDLALWDLKGQAEELPLWKLLGGERNSCPAYASALLWDEPANMAKEASRHLQNGFRRMKMRMGQGEDRDLEAVQTIRQTIGAEHDLMVDAGMRLSLPAARRIANKLAENGVFWFEEPFPPEDVDVYAAARDFPLPVAAGENEFGIQGFSELIERRAVDIVQPDVSRCGGLSETRKIIQAAANAGLNAATHSWSDAIAIVGNAHIIASAPNGITVEVDQTGNPFVDSLLEEPLQIHDGQLRLSDAPGLGIRLNESVAEKYRLSNPYDIPAGRYSDMVFGADQWTPAGPYQEILPAYEPDFRDMPLSVGVQQ